MKTSEELRALNRFLMLVLALVIGAICVTPHYSLAIWFGFGVAGYSVIANDSIQTLGTLLSSTRKIPWWLVWLLTGSILAFVLSYGWYVHHGDFSWGRLTSIPQPEHLSTLELLAPVALLVLTRFSFPVSTTFLILSVFSSQVVIQQMLIKSFMGYIVAFMFAFVLWTIASKYIRFKQAQYNRAKWRVLQFLATGYLWSQWLQHDISNVVVFLPRQMPLWMMVTVVSYFLVLLAFILQRHGGAIQCIVQEKTDTADIRVATAIDFCFGFILIVFKEISNIPMSTTWIFLGILAGRELAMAFYSNQYHYGKVHALKLMRKDITRAAIGLLISLLLVIFIVEI